VSRYIEENKRMPYTLAHKKAMKKWRDNNLEYTREKARENMTKYRAKWREFWNESKRLLSITLD